jgi:urease accessory protein
MQMTTTRRSAIITPHTIMGIDRSMSASGFNGNGGDRLLTLLQLTNAAFPTGAFTHSYGFETWIEDRTIVTAADADRHCSDWLRFNLATCDAVAAALSHRWVLRDEFSGLVGIDRQLGALKLSRESRSASKMTGAALIAAGRDIFNPPQISRLAEMIRAGDCEGHHAVVYGTLSVGLGLNETETVTSFLWSGLSSLVGVVQRLVPLGQTEAQRIIAGAGPLIDRCADIARMRDLQSMSASLAALDVASMRHERLHTRLCIS